MAVDLPGFGQSEGRPDVLSPSGMGAILPQILRALGLPRVHGVGPDVGTSALLFAAKDQPALFESLIVGSGATSADTTGATLKDLIFAPTLADLENLDGAVVALGAIDSSLYGGRPRLGRRRLRRKLDLNAAFALQPVATRYLAYLSATLGSGSSKGSAVSPGVQGPA